MIYAILNQKGGVAKTTTALALADGLIERGRRVLVVDVDPQCNGSFTAGAALNGPSAYEVLAKGNPILEAIQDVGRFHIVAASQMLAGADAELTGPRKEYRLKDALAPILAAYDDIVIDTPPALGILTVNALVAADSVVIPTSADIFALLGIRQLASTIGIVRAINTDLQVAGILLCRHSPRTVLARDLAGMIQDTAAGLDTRVFRSTIREGIAVREAQAVKASLFRHAPKAAVTEDYRAFIAELIGR